MMTKNRVFLGVLLLFSTTWALPSFAKLSPEQERAAFSLLQTMPDQPTVRDIHAAFGNDWPTLAEFYYQLTQRPSDGTQEPEFYLAAPSNDLPDAALESMARAIATIERVYPNAVVATLGRDAQVFGVWFEAFWVSLGQYDRRIHLPASGASFSDRNDFATSSRFLFDSGVDLFGSKRSYLIYDRTNNRDAVRNSSQSTSLVRSLFWAWMKEGGDPFDLARRFSVLSFAQGTMANTLNGLGPDAEIEAYFSSQAEHFKNEQYSLEFPPVPSSAFWLLKDHTSVSWSDGMLWHSGYSTLAVQADGKMRGLPGTPSNQFAILRMQLSLIRQVATPKFLKMVRAAANDLGYSFPVPARAVPQSVKVVTPPRPTFEDVKRVLTEIRSHLSGEVPDQKGNQLTPNAQLIYNWLTTSTKQIEDAEALVLEVLDTALLEKEAGRISARDARTLIALALAHFDLQNPSEKFVTHLKNRIDANPKFRQKFFLARQKYFDNARSRAQFDWIRANLIIPNGWDCEEDLTDVQEAS